VNQNATFGVKVFYRLQLEQIPARLEMERELKETLPSVSFSTGASRREHAVDVYIEEESGPAPASD